MANEIIVKLDENNEITLTSDMPNLVLLVETIVKIQNTLDVEKLEVTTEDENFDCESFKDVLKTSITTFVEQIEIQNRELEEILLSLGKK